MEVERVGARRNAEFVAQQRSQPLVDAQRFRAVARASERVHKEAVATLPIRRAGDKLASGSLGRGELGTANAKASLGIALQRA